METNHTPGPWKIEKSSSFNQIGERFIVRTSDTSKNIWDQICEVGIIHTGLMGGTPAANAKLIAAAPELLQALDYALEVIWMHTPEIHKTGFNPNDCIKQAREAIKKATE